MQKIAYLSLAHVLLCTVYKTACGLVCEMKSCLCMLNYWLSNTSACAHSIRVIVVMNATIEIITWEYCLVVHFVNWERSCMLD